MFHTKFLPSKSDPLICVHKHALSSVHFLHRARVCLFCFPNCAYLIFNCCFSTLFKKW